MNIEETKKIIQNKIQADEAAREVIHERQNVREGFTETFKPLIEASEKVKESIDTQQNKLIKQLQENQLALTQSFEGNRKAITSGFDKMDEVKKWDLEQLPGYEATLDVDEESEKKDEGEEESVKKPKITTLTYEEDEMDEFLNNKESIDLLNFYGLKLPSKYKDKSLGELQKAFEKGMEEAANLIRSIKNVAEYKKDTLTGLILAYPIKGQQSKENSKELIKQYNIMQIFINNMGQLRNYKKLTGTGIIHFNNPQQLVNRLELLADSILAGNNGVKQEFSQIAYLLHQLKVITKKTLNDLLKKYILFK